MTVRYVEPVAVAVAVCLLAAAFVAVLFAWQSMWAAAVVFVVVPVLAVVCDQWKADR